MQKNVGKLSKEVDKNWKNNHKTNRDELFKYVNATKKKIELSYMDFISKKPTAPWNSAHWL